MGRRVTGAKLRDWRKPNGTRRYMPISSKRHCQHCKLIFADFGEVKSNTEIPFVNVSCLAAGGSTT